MIAQDSSIRWQEKHLNSLYNQYLATGARPAQDLQEAVQALVTATTLQSPPPLTIPTKDGEKALTFENQTFAYKTSGDSLAADARQLVGSSPLVLNEKRSGGTATYGGQELSGLGSIPAFMLSASNGEFRFHNNGGYEGVEGVHSLQPFLDDLQPSEDRFNPTSSKVLSLEKDGTRYDFNFILWDDGLQLRLVNVSKYQ